MKITREFLKEKRACSDGFKWWCDNCEGLSDVDQIKKLAEHRFSWANWLIVRIMSYEQYVSYAIFAAEQVIGIYEKKYPEDKRPRKAIEAAKECLKDPSGKNKKAAYAAAGDAYAAAYTAYAAAAYAAYAAAGDADDADDAAYAAAAYAATARNKLRKKIINYGIKLLED
jgi:hypothetical protein